MSDMAYNAFVTENLKDFNNASIKAIDIIIALQML